MTVANKSLITKGVFAVSIVAATALVGVVGFAKADTAGGNGYGTGSEQALAAADKFDADFGSASTSFRDDVAGIVAQSKTELTGAGAAKASDFQTKFNTASDTYDGDVQNALDAFRTAVQAAKNTAVSKDQFIDRFNHAKADYFNALEAAKNKFADDLNRLGGNDVAKDQFMNRYNSVKDSYGNELETIKNAFAASIG